jgi:glycosyltransferase involved in cell wall biosynthesis
METFKEPWNISFQERLKKLTDAKEKMKVVYIAERPDPSSFRYRVYNICQALDLSNLWVGSYFYEHELSLLDSLIPSIDLFVFCRVRWSFEIDSLMAKVKKQKIPTIFDIDDLVFNLEKIPLFLNTLGLRACDGEYNNWFSHFSRYWMTARSCDYTSGTNTFLSDQLKKVFQKPSFVISNFLNQEQIETSEKLLMRKKEVLNASFTIGYFSGTPSHKNDFNKIAPELADFLENYPETQLEVVGYMEFPEVLKKFAKTKQLFHSPLVDYLTLQSKKAAVHINLAPLFLNDFTNCKSELKFFEAAIVGTVTCATPTYVFKSSIKNGETGFLCEEGDWYDAFVNIYQNQFSPHMVSKAREYCLHHYSPQTQYKYIENVFNQALAV